MSKRLICYTCTDIVTDTQWRSAAHFVCIQLFVCQNKKMGTILFKSRCRNCTKIQYAYLERGQDISPLDNSPGHFPPGEFPLPIRTIPPVPLKTQLENYIYTYMYAHMHTYIHTC